MMMYDGLLASLFRSNVTFHVDKAQLLGNDMTIDESDIIGHT